MSASHAFANRLKAKKISSTGVFNKQFLWVVWSYKLKVNLPSMLRYQKEVWLNHMISAETSQKSDITIFFFF